MEEENISSLDKDKIEEYLKELKEWQLIQETKRISRIFNFKNFREAIEFVNDVANVAERQKHYPDIIIRQKKVVIELNTPSIKGLSKNDFIIAAEIDNIADWKVHWERFLTSRPVLIILIIILLVVLIWRYYF